MKAKARARAWWMAAFVLATLVAVAGTLYAQPPEREPGGDGGFAVDASEGAAPVGNGVAAEPQAPAYGQRPAPDPIHPAPSGQRHIPQSRGPDPDEPVTSDDALEPQPSPPSVQAPSDSGGSGATSINSFEECARAGYPIAESYPEQCRTPDGRLFVREVP